MDFYLLAKALHIIAFVAWFAGLFYLPRLFVYHVQADAVSLPMLCTMEHKLYRYIMWPAAIITTVIGVSLLALNPSVMAYGAFHVKFLLVFVLWGFHLSLGLYVKRFAAAQNNRSERFFRLYNEVPTLLLIAIVILAVMKPF